MLNRLLKLQSSGKPLCGLPSNGSVDDMLILFRKISGHPLDAMVFAVSDKRANTKDSAEYNIYRTAEMKSQGYHLN